VTVHAVFQRWLVETTVAGPWLTSVIFTVQYQVQDFVALLVLLRKVKTWETRARGSVASLDSLLVSMVVKTLDLFFPSHPHRQLG
jgi:hypothetical protein